MSLRKKVDSFDKGSKLRQGASTMMKAILTKEVQYVKMGEVITLEIGTQVDFDNDNEICLVDKRDYVQLNGRDYKVVEN